MHIHMQATSSNSILSSNGGVTVGGTARVYASATVQLACFAMGGLRAPAMMIHVSQVSRAK